MISKLDSIKNEIDQLSSEEQKELMKFLQNRITVPEPLYPTKSGTEKEFESSQPDSPRKKLKSLKQKYYW